MKIPFYLLLAICYLLLFNCRKDAPPSLPNQGSINLSTGKRLLICDEGNYGQNNAAVSIFSPLNNLVILSAFTAANPNYTLGDVVQSISKIEGNYYLVVNNSGTIVVCNGNFVRTATISGFISPRYIQYVYNGEAYVSNLQLDSTKQNYIQVININTNTITKTIHINGWTEEMQLANGKVYVCNQSKNYVYVINTQTDALIDSIFMGTTSACIVKDENNKLWVSCNSDSTASIHIPASLVRINPANDSIEANINLGTISNAISRLCINGTGTTLYYLMTNVYKMSITATACPTTPLIQQGSHTFYGLCIDPDDETIYVSDALNYNSNGKLYHYQSNSNLLGTYMVGVIPGFMMIDE
jgi:YVTN family beta-propeller protein